MKKAEKKEKKAAAKDGSGGASANAAAATATSGVGKSAGVKEPTLYPGDDVDGTHTVLAVAHVGGAKLARGYGVKPSFFGKGPFLELPHGHVISGIEGVVRAVALVGRKSRSVVGRSNQSLVPRVGLVRG